jgi:diketogulonate reductase-like aldo/keto reductase
VAIPSVPLPNGDELPMVGLGTGGLGTEAVRTALDIGYTRLDTAEAYGNEAEIGEAIADYDREELFLTSKVRPANLHYESVIEACEDSLDRLGTDSLDLYLIHWPNPAISLRETLDAMETLHDDGKVRSVGVSNFSAYQLSNANHITDVPIAVNQVEFHPWFQRPDLVEYCEETDVVVEASAPLARTEVFDEAVIGELAEAYDKTPAQVVLRWAFERDVATIPGSGSADHLEANLAVFDWELEEADQQRLTDLDRNQAVYEPTAPDWTGGIFDVPR